MIPEFPTEFSPEQARNILSTLKFRTRCPNLWSGLVMYFSGMDLHPGCGQDARYAMLFIHKEHSQSGIGVDWDVIDGGKRTHHHNTFTSIRYDARANAFDFLGAGQEVQIPVNGSLDARFIEVRSCIQHTLEEFA